MQNTAPKSTASETVYEVIRQRIMTNRLPGGSHLLEEAVATELEVSRTPVREALSRLESDGLIQSIKRHGYLVTPITIPDINEIYQVLSPLEIVAAELLATKDDNEDIVAELQKYVDEMALALEKDDLDQWAAADEMFHMRLVESCGNGRLAKAAKLLFAQSHRVRLFTLRLREKPVNSVKNHGALVDAIRQHRPDLAREIHAAHRVGWVDKMSDLLASLNIHQL